MSTCLVSTTTSPRTHAEAAKVAETVTADELLALCAERSATIFEPNTPRRHAYICQSHKSTSGQTVIGSYDYCSNRTGHGKVDSFIASGRDADPIFDFYNVGRIVRLGR